MAKKVTALIKLQVKAGMANPSPPVGPALGQHGVNIMEFCKGFNARTESLDKGMPIPVVITVYSDRSFTFETRTPPASFLLLKAAALKSGSGRPNGRAAPPCRCGWPTRCASLRRCGRATGGCGW